MGDYGQGFVPVCAGGAVHYELGDAHGQFAELVGLGLAAAHKVFGAFLGDSDVTPVCFWEFTIIPHFSYVKE